MTMSVGNQTAPRYVGASNVAQPTTATTATTATQAPAGPQTGAPAADNFTAAQPGAATKQANPNQKLADEVINEYKAAAGPAEAYNNHDWDGRNALTRDMSKKVGTEVADWIMQQVNAGRVPPQAEIDAFMAPKTAAIEAEVNGKFGPAPPNPSAHPAPDPAFDWKGRGKLEKDLNTKLGEETANWIMGQVNGGTVPNQAQIDAFMAPKLAANQSQLDGAFPGAPTILEAQPKDPNYDYARRDQVTQDIAKQVADQITEKVKSGASPEEVGRFADEVTKNLDQRINELCGTPNPPPAYDTKNDEPGVYAQNRYQMEQRIEEMQQNGTPPDQIQGYQLQRQAELAQIFPKQSMLNETKDGWKAVCQQMAANGKSEAEIKEWLDKKTEKYTEPTAEELTVFSQKKAQEAAQIQALVASNNQASANMKKMTEQLKKAKEAEGGDSW